MFVMERVHLNSTKTVISNDETENIFSTLEELYHASQCYVANAIHAQEERNNKTAIQHYMNALQCLEKGVSIDGSGLSDERYSAMQVMQLKMAPVMEEVRSQLYKLQEAPAPSGSSVPRYSLEVPEGHSSVPSAPTEANDQLCSVREALSQQNTWLNGAADGERAVQLLCIPDGVQMFTVEENLQVNSPPPSYPTSLNVYLFDDQTSSSSSRPPAFIQIGDWVYPLIPNQSPVLHCSNGAYIFPDLHGSSQERSVGLVISSTVDPSLEEAFSSILSNLACLQVQQHRLEGEPEINLSSSLDYHPGDSTQDEESDLLTDKKEQSDEEKKKSSEEEDEEPSTSQKIVSGIETSASWLSWGLSKGAELTSSLIQRGATQLQDNITPDEKPLSINPTLQKGIYYTHEASKVAVQVSHAVIKGLCVVAGELTRIVSPHITSYLSPQEPEKSAPDGKADGKAPNVSGVLTVAGAGLSGFGRVWKSLEQSGMAIAQSVSSATTDTMQHKYGPEAGRATSQAMGAVVNLGRAVHSVDHMMISALVDRTRSEAEKEEAKDGQGEAGTSSSANGDVLKDFCRGNKRSM